MIFFPAHSPAADATRPTAESPMPGRAGNLRAGVAWGTIGRRRDFSLSMLEPIWFNVHESFPGRAEPRLALKVAGARHHAGPIANVVRLSAFTARGASAPRQIEE